MQIVLSTPKGFRDGPGNGYCHTHIHTEAEAESESESEVEVVSEHKLIEMKVSAALCVNTFYGIL